MRNSHHILFLSGIASALLAVSCGQTEPEQPAVRASFEAKVAGEEQATRGVPVEDLSSFKARVELFTIWGFMNSVNIDDFYDRDVRLFGSRYYPIKNGEFDYITLPKELTRDNEMFYGLAADRTENTVNVTQAMASGIQFNYQAHEPITDPVAEFYHRDAEALGEVLAGILVSGGVNEDGIIPLDFYHPMAAVRFRVGSDNTKKITITQIVFNGVATTGTCKFYRDNTKNIVINWSNIGTSKKSYLQTYDNEISASTPSGVEINDGQSRKAWFFVPQTFGADASIEITYEMNSIPHTFTIPLEGVEYEANNVYWYTLSKGGVIFESQVNSWGSGVSQTHLYTEPGIEW